MTKLQAALEAPADYHSDYSAVSHSMLEVYRESPVTYAALYVTRTMQQPPPTPAMCLGTALHALLLEPDQYDNIVAVAPDIDRRTKLGKETWSAFLETITNLHTVITGEQNDIVTQMAKSVLAHPEAKKLFERAECREQPFRWTNEQTGVRCKCKPDLLWTAGRIIGDIKTTSNPNPGAWSRQAASFGYDRQGAWYSLGLETCFQSGDFKFLHICVGSQEPWECACYFIENEFMEHARFQNQQTLNSLAIAQRTNTWVSEQNTKFKTLALPRWTLYE